MLKEPVIITNELIYFYFSLVHDYQYFRPFFEDSTYKVARMASEYGLESFPSLESLEHVYEEQDMSYNSDLNNYRQHHGAGGYFLFYWKYYIQPLTFYYSIYFN